MIYFPCGSDGKVSVYNAGNLDSIPGLGRFPGEEIRCGVLHRRLCMTVLNALVIEK